MVDETSSPAFLGQRISRHCPNMGQAATVTDCVLCEALLNLADQKFELLFALIHGLPWAHVDLKQEV